MTPRVTMDCERMRYFHTGLGQYCFRLAKEFLRLNRPWRPVFYMPKQAAVHLQVERSLWRPTHRWHQYWPWALNGSEIWHCTHQDAKYLPTKGKIVLTIHDLNFLNTKSKSKKRHKLKKLQQKLNRASAVSVISRYTQSQVEQHLNLPEGLPIHVIYNGAEKSETTRRPGWLRDQPFFFSLGVILPKKNFHVLLPMMKHFPEHQLIIAGSDEHPYADALKKQIHALGLANRVSVVGVIDGPEKAWLYQNSDAFLFPSLMEGFGLPVVEAMHWGQTVVCSSLTSLPEVGGELASYWNDFEADSMAEILKRALSQRSPERAQRIQDWASQFTWERSALGYAALYESLL